MTDHDKAAYARQILSAVFYDDMVAALTHWGTFVPFARVPCLDSEDDWGYLNREWSVLDRAAYRWLINYQLASLSAEIAALRGEIGQVAIQTGLSDLT